MCTTAGGLGRRRGGRPLIGSAPAGVAPVRLDPELCAAVEARATVDQTTNSDVICEALRHFLDVASCVRPDSRAVPQHRRALNPTDLVATLVVTKERDL